MFATILLSLGLAGLDVQPAPYVDRVAAVVGDDVILVSEVRARASLVARSQHVPVSQLTDAILRQVAEHMTEEYLIDAEAKRAHIVISDDEVNRAVEQLATGNNTSVAAFLKQVEQQGLKTSELKDALRRQLTESKLLLMRSNQMQRIEDKDLQARYELVKRQVKDPKDLKTFEELKPELFNELLQERIQSLREDWLAQLRARTHVEVRIGSPS